MSKSSTQKEYALPVFAFYGASNSGKTTLVCQVIKQLNTRGVRVATAKGHMHNLELDVPGKDSYKHAEAGAELSMLSVPNGWLAVHKTTGRVDLSVLAHEAKRSGCDILIVEGYKDEPCEKIEVTSENRDLLKVVDIADMLEQRIAESRK